jgi:hypothetical protein
MRTFFLGLLATTACTGSIGDMGGDDDVPPPATDVQIRVRDGNTAIAGVNVIFQAADETVIAEVITDATGTALAEMPEGGNLTVIRRYPPPATPEEELRPTEVYTYVGVEAGDRLELGAKIDELAPPSAINVMVPETAQGTITVNTSCGTGQGQAPLIPITVRGCNTSMTVYVMDGDQGSFVKQTAFSELVDVSSEPLLGTLASTLTATGVTLGTQVRAEKRIEMGGFQLFSTGERQIETTPATVDVPNLTGVDELLLTSITDVNNRRQLVAARQTYVKGTTVVDGSIGLIPYVENPNYSPTGLSWVEAGPAQAQPNMVLATLTITRDLGGLPPGADDIYVRAIVAPHAGTSLRMPMLSGLNAKFNPGATDQIAGAVGLVQFSGEYAAARPVVFTANNILDTAPMNGRVVLSYAGGTPPGL